MPKVLLTAIIIVEFNNKVMPDDSRAIVEGKAILKMNDNENKRYAKFIGTNFECLTTVEELFDGTFSWNFFIENL